MKPASHYFHTIAALVAIILILCLTVSCGGEAEPEATGFTPTAPADSVPEGVLNAREAVLAEVREVAIQCVPPKQAKWTQDEVPVPPEGYDVYRFLSSDCAITVTVSQEPTDDPIYHVALGDGATGFCWQAIVNRRGQILRTGSEAQTDPVFGNPAKNYCEANGYTFEMVTLSSGQMCGTCNFDNGLSCNAWAYFHGACTPENAPTPEP